PQLPIPTAENIPLAPLPASTGEPPLPTPDIRPVSATQEPNPGAPMPLPLQALPPGADAPGSPAKVVPNCPWSLTVEIIDGRTQLTAQNGKEVKFTISCDKLDVQTPRGRIDATGKVKLAAEHLEGGCERLTISWQEDVVVLERAQLKCKLQGQEADLNAEQLRLRLSRVVSE